MLKKTVVYTDYNGNERQEDLYFNLTEAEIVKGDYESGNSLSDKLTKITESNDPSKIMGVFEKIITGSYGKKSEDGRRFIKSPELTEEFLHSAAYSALFMELISPDSEFTPIDFIKGVLPASIANEIDPIVSNASTAEGDIPEMPLSFA